MIQLNQLNGWMVDSISRVTGFDSSNVNAIDDFFIEHARDGSVDMNLTDSVGAFSTIIHGIGLECWDHNLVSNTTVVVSATAVFCEIILINEHLAFVSEVL